MFVFTILLYGGLYHVTFRCLLRRCGFFAVALLSIGSHVRFNSSLQSGTVSLNVSNVSLLDDSLLMRMLMEADS